MTALASVLERLGISQYLEAFLAEGFDTWETLLDVTEEDLDALNVKRGHRRKLQREIANARGVPNDRPLKWPSPPRKLTGEDVGGEVEKTSSSPGNSGPGDTPAKAGKRKYRRHPKPDEHAPEKPPSAYVIFSNRIRERMRGQSLSFAEMAKVVGQNWQALTTEQKETYEAEAAAAKQAYNEKVAEYMKTDDFKNYMEYLADFRARQGIQPADVKRRKPEVDGVTRGTEGAARATARRQTAEGGSGDRVRTTSVDLASVDSVSSGQPSPFDPAPSSIPCATQSRHTPAHVQRSGRDISIGQSPVSPTSSTILSGVGRPSFSLAGRSSSRVEGFDDSPLRAGYGRGPNPSPRLMSNEESYAPGPFVTLPPPAAPISLPRDALAPFPDVHRADAPTSLSPPMDAMLPPLSRPPPPILPPLRASPTASYASTPSSHIVVLSRSVSSASEGARHHSIDGIPAHKTHQGQQDLRAKSAPSKPYRQERSPVRRPSEESLSQDPRPSTPISVLLKASESISEREPDRQVNGER